jgi:hypothetical protein
VCFLQGVLAQAKNGEKLFWEEKFHTANGKAQACTQGVLPLVWVEGEGFFLMFPWFSMCSHYVPFKFPMGSHQVPQHILHSTSLLSHMLWQMLSSFHLYISAKGEELYTSK